MKYIKIIKRETKIMLGIVVILVVIVLGVSYALFMQVTDNTNNQVITTGTLQVEYESSNGYITNDLYNNLLPMSNDKGLEQAGYSFSVKNTGNLPVTYKVYMYVNEADYNADRASGKVTGDLFNDLSLLKYNVEVNNVANTNVSALSETEVKTENNINKYVIYTGTVSENSAKNSHKLRIWLNEEIDETNINKYIYLKLEVSSFITGQE